MAADGEQIELAGTTSADVLKVREPVSRARVETLIKEHYQELRLLILKSTRNEATAADILNDAIATALEHLNANRIAQPEQIAGYVYQVAMNHLRNHRRKIELPVPVGAFGLIDALSSASCSISNKYLLPSTSTTGVKSLIGFLRSAVPFASGTTTRVCKSESKSDWTFTRNGYAVLDLGFLFC